MGASEWTYVTPYEGDVALALTRLQERVFADGEYYRDRPVGEPRTAEQIRDEIHAAIGDDIDAESLLAMAREQAAQENAPEPTSIQELLERQPESGTHSILDMALGVREMRQAFAVAPLTQDELRSAFGSTRPSREQVLEWARHGRVDTVRGRWEGCYVPVGDDEGEPTEVVFVGFSGD